MSIHSLNKKIREKLEDIGHETLNKMGKFETNKCNIEVNLMCNHICNYLNDIKSKYKFVVNCVMFDRNSNGISLNGGCLWNTRKDQFLRIECVNKTLILLINVWVISMD